MNAPTLIDLPLDIIREIVLLIDGPDTIALRQVHRTFFNLPVKLTGDVRGLDQIDINIVINYPSIHSFTVVDADRMDWFFKLGPIYQGYNNIRQLEIKQAIEIRDPLPRDLEILHIIPEKEKQIADLRVDLASLKKLRILKCSSVDGISPVDINHTYKLTLCRPDISIPWNRGEHLVELDCAPRDFGDLSIFTNLRTLTIRTFDDIEYTLPTSITKLMVKNSVVPDLMDLRNLRYLHLQFVDISKMIDLDDISSRSLTYLNLEHVTFLHGLTHLDFTNFRELTALYLTINKRISENGEDDINMTCKISGNQKLEKISFNRIKTVGGLPRALIDIYMIRCKLNSSLGSIDSIKHLSINYTHLIDTHLPPNLETLVLADNTYPEHNSGYRLFNLISLKTLTLRAVTLDGPISPNITELFIARHNQDLNLSHLSRLSSLTIDSGFDRWLDRTSSFINSLKTHIIGPLPISLSYLDLEASTHFFDLTDLVNLETLNIAGWNNNIAGMGTLPPSIKLLITDVDFELRTTLPNLLEHKRPVSFWKPTFAMMHKHKHIWDE